MSRFHNGVRRILIHCGLSEKDLCDSTVPRSSVYMFSLSLSLLAILFYSEERVAPEVFSQYQPIPEKNELFLQRPASLALDPTDNLYVLDIEARMVFIWDRNGQFTGVLGQGGEGPGEFSFSDWNYYQAHISCSNDAIYIFDGARKRVHIFNSDRRYLKSVSLPLLKGRARYFGMTRDGHALLVGQEYLNRTYPSIKAVLYDSDWAPVKELAGNADKSFETAEDGRITIHVFEPRLVTYCDPTSDEIILGYGDQNWFDLLDAKGNRKKRVFFQIPRRRVEKEDIEEYKRSSFLKQQSHYLLSFREWWPYYTKVLPYGKRGFLIVNISSVDKNISGILIDREGNTLDRIQLTCGENGGLFGSRGKIFTVKTDKSDDFVVEAWRPCP